MDALTRLLREIYTDAYLQGRQDGLEGLHVNPQLVISHYLNDKIVHTKLTELGILSLQAIDLH